MLRLLILLQCLKRLSGIDTKKTHIYINIVPVLSFYKIRCINALTEHRNTQTNTKQRLGPRGLFKLNPALTLCHVFLKPARYKLNTNSLEAALSQSSLSLTLLRKDTHLDKHTDRIKTSVLFLIYHFKFLLQPTVLET